MSDTTTTTNTDEPLPNRFPGDPDNPDPRVWNRTEAVQYCRSVLGIGGTYFDRYIRPRLDFRPLFYDEEDQAWTTYRFRVEQVMEVVEEILEERKSNRTKREVARAREAKRKAQNEAL